MELRPVALDELPCNTPVIMMTVSGDTLGMPKAEACFVELIGTDGLVTIRSAENKWQHLTRDYRWVCRFGRPAEALKFEPKMSPTRRLVFELEGTGHILGFAMEGQLKVLICREEYWKDTQSWMLLQQHKHDDSCARLDMMDEAAANENELAGRCELAMHFVEMGKTTEELKQIIDLLYGSGSPQKTPVTMATAIAVERRRQILKMLMSGKSLEDARNILRLMYGTSSPILKVDASNSIRGTELTVSSGNLGHDQDKEESLEAQFVRAPEFYECSD